MRRCLFVLALVLAACVPRATRHAPPLANTAPHAAPSPPPPPSCGAPRFTTRLRGCVHDSKTGQPVVGVTIVAHQPDGSLQAVITDDTGAWGVDVPGDAVPIDIYYDTILLHAVAQAGVVSEVAIDVPTEPEVIHVEQLPCSDIC